MSARVSNVVCTVYVHFIVADVFLWLSVLVSSPPDVVVKSSLEFVGVRMLGLAQRESAIAPVSEVDLGRRLSFDFCHP